MPTELPNWRAAFAKLRSSLSKFIIRLRNTSDRIHNEHKGLLPLKLVERLSANLLEMFVHSRCTHVSQYIEKRAEIKTHGRHDHLRSWAVELLQEISQRLSMRQEGRMYGDHPQFVAIVTTDRRPLVGAASSSQLRVCARSISYESHMTWGGWTFLAAARHGIESW